MTLLQPLTAARATIGSNPVDYSDVPLAKLIEACANGDNAAWRAFIERYNRILAITVARVARHWGEPSPHIIDDLVQETYLKLCADRARVMREFRLDHPNAIYGFLKVVASNVAHDYFRRESNKTHGGGQPTEPLEQGREPAVASEGPLRLMPAEGTVLLNQVDELLRTMLPPENGERDRKIFWLRFRQGLTAEEISLLPLGLSVKGVESTLRRTVALVRSCLVEGMGRGTASGV